MSLTAAEKETWDALKGFSNPIVKEYNDRKPGNYKKYERIQKCLYHEEVSFQPVRAIRKGPGCVAPWFEGVQQLAKVMPKRKTTIPNALKQIEEELDVLGYKVTWGQMTWIFKPVYTRYNADIVLGADVFIEGVTDNGIRICYFYDNASHAEEARRWLIIDKKKVRIGDAHEVLDNAY